MPRSRPWPTASTTVTPTWPGRLLDGVDHRLDPLADHDCLDLDHRITSDRTFHQDTTSRQRPSRRPMRRAHADDPEPAAAVKREARLVLREDPGLDRPDPGELRVGDEPRRAARCRRPARALARDVDAVLGDARVALGARRARAPPSRRSARPAADQPVAGEVSASHASQEGLRLERGLPPAMPCCRSRSPPASRPVALLVSPCRVRTTKKAPGLQSPEAPLPQTLAFYGERLLTDVGITGRQSRTCATFFAAGECGRALPRPMLRLV